MVNTKIHYLKPSDLKCISSLTHQKFCGHRVIELVGDHPVGNKELGCGGCHNYRLTEYAHEVNERRLTCSFELFYDLKQLDDLEEFTNKKYDGCEKCLKIDDLSAKLQQIYQDFKAMCAEKKYISELKNKVEAAHYLTSIQGWEPHLDMIKAPRGRFFTLPQEFEALQVLSEGKPFEINFSNFSVKIPDTAYKGETI